MCAFEGSTVATTLITAVTINLGVTLMEERRTSISSSPMKTVPMLKDVPKPLGPYSHVVVANDFIFIAGQAPRKPSDQPGKWAGTTITDQTQQCLRNIETILKGLGGTLSDAVKVTVYLADPSLYNKMNEAYGEFFTSEPPARSVARLGAEVTGLLVTIDAIAVHSKTANPEK